MLHVGRWKTFVSVFPIKISEVDELLDDPLEDPPDEDPPDEEPPEEVPEPVPVLSVVPLGNVKTAPLVEKTTFPFLSVL